MYTVTVIEVTKREKGEYMSKLTFEIDDVQLRSESNLDQ